MFIRKTKSDEYYLQTTPPVNDRHTSSAMSSSVSPTTANETNSTSDRILNTLQNTSSSDKDSTNVYIGNDFTRSYADDLASSRNGSDPDLQNKDSPHSSETVDISSYRSSDDGDANYPRSQVSPPIGDSNPTTNQRRVGVTGTTTTPPISLSEIIVAASRQQTKQYVPEEKLRFQDDWALEMKVPPPPPVAPYYEGEQKKYKKSFLDVEGLIM